MALTPKNTPPSQEGGGSNPQETKVDSNLEKQLDQAQPPEDENLETEEDKEKAKGKESKKETKTTKQDAKVTLRHPTSQTDGTIGLYLPTGEEVAVPVKKGIVTLEHNQYEIRDVLIKDGFIDRTVYSAHEQESTVKEPEKRMIKKASFLHPDASQDVPINGSIGLYLNDGREVKVEVVKNVIETKDQEIYEALLAQNFPTGPVEFK
ncbi:hypothetical protein [Leptospira phage LE3]|uniref:Uncharacterized protein n=1 Tax=Leptospira phage LE3 TaxID=2041382 RepID=A0A343LE56_9CAUD|nr:hypothetical protein HWB33_gp28 [Leptospira phage LE3]ATN94966.1 hypothetical protein [Leptospira phage LE3]